MGDIGTGLQPAESCCAVDRTRHRPPCCASCIAAESRYTYQQPPLRTRSLGHSPLQGKLEMITGATAGLMELRLDDADGHKIGVLSDDSKMLGAYPVEDYCTLMVLQAVLFLSFSLSSSACSPSLDVRATRTSPPLPPIPRSHGKCNVVLSC